MESYQRRRFRDDTANDRDHQQQFSIYRDSTGCRTSFTRHGVSAPLALHPPSASTSHHQTHSIETVEVGSAYEINHHFQLPTRILVRLRFVRVAMVCEKYHQRFTVRFPSIESLKTYFQSSERLMCPELDQKFEMGINLASKVLYRKISPDEFAGKKNAMDFWLLNPGIAEFPCSNKGSLLPALKCRELVVYHDPKERCKPATKNVIEATASSQYVNHVRHCTSPHLSHSAYHHQYVDHGTDLALTIVNGNEVEETREEEEDESETDAIGFAGKKTVEDELYVNTTRKRYRKAAKEITCEKENSNKCRDLVLFHEPKDRWLNERCTLATKNVLEGTRGRESTAFNPIIRPDLRGEARKKTGDTGSLDHILRHMAGKHALGGKDRFRRRDGALEYWLEEAEIAHIRKKGPACAKEFRKLKEEKLDLPRKSQDMVAVASTNKCRDLVLFHDPTDRWPKKLFDEEGRKSQQKCIDEGMDALATSKKDNEAATILLSIRQKPNQHANSSVSSKCHTGDEAAALPMDEVQLADIPDLEIAAKGIEVQSKSISHAETSGFKSTTALTLDHFKVQPDLTRWGSNTALMAVISNGVIGFGSESQVGSPPNCGPNQKKYAQLFEDLDVFIGVTGSGGPCRTMLNELPGYCAGIKDDINGSLIVLAGLVTKWITRRIDWNEFLLNESILVVLLLGIIKEDKGIFVIRRIPDTRLFDFELQDKPYVMLGCGDTVLKDYYQRVEPFADFERKEAGKRGYKLQLPEYMFRALRHVTVKKPATCGGPLNIIIISAEGGHELFRWEKHFGVYMRVPLKKEIKKGIRW